ncbi:PTS transporter subunit EIIC [Spiroplasma eriocheiris]|uniref:PTS transporter subunit EIIC n=1 Tax=Spiroplasma eriocheiris TaxID=315358 RepID=UPI00202A78AE|nr:PTS transporter subunit EIIC [Spiroplasma eriocheiris]
MNPICLNYYWESNFLRKCGFRGGAFVYAFINRLLQPFGGHHIINTFLWFQLPIEGPLLPGINPDNIANIINLGNGNYIVFGDINAYSAGIETSGIFQSGFFPVFFGGIPATGLAMIMTAHKSRRREVATFIGGVALVSFLTGIDEPLVFIWIFLSPLLLVIHAVLTAIFAAVVVGMGIRLGFGFSAGLIDYLISVPKSWIMSLQHDSVGARIAANPLWVFPISMVMGVIYYFIWYWLIKKMNIPTPGRDLNDNRTGQPAGTSGGDMNVSQATTIQAENQADLQMIAQTQVQVGAKLKGKAKRTELANKYQQMAQTIVDVVGKDNFKIIENCATRLRLIVKDNKTNIDDAKLKASGIFGIIRIGNEGLQLVIGTDVEHVANRVRDLVGPL